MTFSDLSVFVYGTLKPGGHYWHRFCEGKICGHTPARIRGELYDLGCGYPGAVFNEAGWIEGVVLEFKHAVDLEAVDELEGYRPGASSKVNEYKRRKMACFARKGDLLGMVWAYEVNPHYLNQYDARLLPDGQWCVHS
jgi:gamma-glutamylcyclotransferase (GGCT)/AIG2-like uncharacterized protein YtfP